MALHQDMKAAVLAAHAGMQQENSKLEGGKLLLRCSRRPEVHGGERGCGDECGMWFCPSENGSFACKGGVNNDGVNTNASDTGGENGDAWGGWSWGGTGTAWHLEEYRDGEPGQYDSRHRYMELGSVIFPCCNVECTEIDHDGGNDFEGNENGCCHYEPGWHLCTLDLEVVTLAGDSYRVQGCINPEDDFEDDDVALMIASQFPVLAPADRFELVLEGEKIDMQKGVYEMSPTPHWRMRIAAGQAPPKVTLVFTTAGSAVDGDDDDAKATATTAQLQDSIKASISTLAALESEMPAAKKSAQDAEAEYERKEQEAKAEYERKEQEAKAEYERKEQEAKAEYERKEQEAKAEHDRKEREAKAEYNDKKHRAVGMLRAKIEAEIAARNALLLHGLPLAIADAELPPSKRPKVD